MVAMLMLTTSVKMTVLYFVTLTYIVVAKDMYELENGIFQMEIQYKLKDGIFIIILISQITTSETEILK